MLFLYLSRCEIIFIEKKMIFLEFTLFGFPTEINYLEVLLKAFCFTGIQLILNNHVFGLLGSLSIISQQN